MPLKLLHAADLHLDSPLKGLVRYEGCPETDGQTATRRALDNLVRLARDEAVEAVLLAGDIFDGDWKDAATGLFFARQMATLGEAGIRVVAVTGNHDARSIVSRELRWPANVTYLSADRAETFRLDDLGLAVHGHGYAQRWEQADLSATYPLPVPGWVNIGLLHTSAEGHPANGTYAPCSVDGLVAHEYDYWALGHVHEYAVLHTDPWVVFPGCAQARHINESGPKGCVLVSVDDGRVASVEFRPLDVVRWATVVVPVDGARSRHAVLDRAAEEIAIASQDADGRVLACRVRLTGTDPAPALLWGDDDNWVDNLRSVCMEIAPGPVWLEGVRFDRTMGDTAGAAGLAALVHEVAAGSAESLMAALQVTPEWQRVGLLLEALPSPVRQEDLRLMDPVDIADLAREAEALIAARSLQRPADAVVGEGA
ncbi:MAG: metallophosphoesterase family protein [Candidatus Dormibacteria bacterium]